MQLFSRYIKFSTTENYKPPIWWRVEGEVLIALNMTYKTPHEWVPPYHDHHIVVTLFAKPSNTRHTNYKHNDHFIWSVKGFVSYTNNYCVTWTFSVDVQARHCTVRCYSRDRTQLDLCALGLIRLYLFIDLQDNGGRCAGMRRGGFPCFKAHFLTNSEKLSRVRGGVVLL